MRIQVLNEMPNLSRNQTGLPYTIWLDPVGDDREVGHNVPRLKINVDGDRVPVSITDNPKILINRRVKMKSPEKVFNWILKNKKHILDYYSGRISQEELESRLIKL